MKLGTRRKVVIGPDSRELLKSIVPVSLLMLGFSPRVLADEIVAADGRYVEVARRLEPWIAAEMATKALPALSIALIDDQRIVWRGDLGSPIGIAAFRRRQRRFIESDQFPSFSATWQ